MIEEKSWSTQQANPGEEVLFWKAAICEAVFELDIKLDPEAALRASIRQRPVGPIGMSLIELNSSQTIVRSKISIAKSQISQFEFVTMQHGRAQLEHKNQTLILNAGDSVLIDNREPYNFSTIPFSRNVSFHIPPSWLEKWIASPQNAAAKKIAGETPWGRAISAMAEAVPMHASINEMPYFNLYADQVAGALALALGNQTDVDLEGAGKLYQQAISLMRSEAHDCELDASVLANKLGISVRYLHKIFAAHGTTYTSELIAFRLCAAARMLQNNQFDLLPINEIAWRSGFGDPSHFYRRFRAKFGIAPGAFRMNKDAFVHH